MKNSDTTTTTNYPKYITFSTKMVTERDRRHYAIKCYNNQQINDILSDLYAYDGIDQIRINNTGKFKQKKNNITIYDGNRYYEKTISNSNRQIIILLIIYVLKRVTKQKTQYHIYE